jgi:hypothetical protein
MSRPPNDSSSGCIVARRVHTELAASFARRCLIKDRVQYFRRISVIAEFGDYRSNNIPRDLLALVRRSRAVGVVVTKFIAFRVGRICFANPLMSNAFDHIEEKRGQVHIEAAGTVALPCFQQDFLNDIFRVPTHAQASEIGASAVRDTHERVPLWLGQVFDSLLDSQHLGRFISF